MTVASINENILRNSIPVAANRNNVALMVLALFWPVAAGAAAFFMLHRRSARFVLGGVMVMIGYRLTLVDERFDAYRLGEFAKELAALNYGEFVQWVKRYCFLTEKCIEPVQPFYTFFLTRLSPEPPVAFAGYALLFAVFSISTLTALRRDKAHGSDLFFYVFLFALMGANPIHNIGGFRFNTASWTFLLGSYLVFFRGRDAGFAFILFAGVFHYAMFFLVALAVFLRLSLLPIRVAIILALSSFFVSGGIELLAPLLNIDYQIGALSRAVRYLSAGALEARADALRRATSSNLFFFFFATTGIKILLGAWMAYILMVKNRIQELGPREARFLSYSLTLFSVANAINEIPSFERYSNIAIQLLYMGFIVSAAVYSRKAKIVLIVLFVPAILFSMLITLRNGLVLVDLYSLLPSPFLLISRDSIL